MLHQETLGFGLNNTLDFFRAAFVSITRDLRVIDEKKTKHTGDQLPMDLIVKFNNLYDYYFAGKLPDEYKYLVLDQKDILKPLLAIVWDSCVSKADLFIRVSALQEEIICCEILKLLVNSIRFKQEAIIMKQEKEEFLCQVEPILDFIDGRLTISLNSDVSRTSVELLRCTLYIIIRVYLHFTKAFPIYQEDPCSPAQFPFRQLFIDLLSNILQNKWKLNVLHNDILLNTLNIIILKRYDIDWRLQQDICHSVISHCIYTNFDLNTKHILLLNSFYVLLRLNFDLYLGEQLPEEIFTSAEISLNFTWDKSSLIFGMFMEEWIAEIPGMTSIARISAQVELLVALCSSLLLLTENMSDETDFDKNSKVVMLAFERLSIEVRDTCFKMFSLIFSQVVSCLNKSPMKKLLL